MVKNTKFLLNMKLSINDLYTKAGWKVNKISDHSMYVKDMRELRHK